jgi:methylated-DNA-protein-cysteine methyltransferase-like protein
VTEFERRVTEVLAALRPGDVVTYGEVAEEAGFPGAARAVGTLLKHSDGLPWWRVVAAGGRLASAQPAEQARRLREEGVAVTPDHRVSRT